MLELKPLSVLRKVSGDTVNIAILRELVQKAKALTRLLQKEYDFIQKDLFENYIKRVHLELYKEMERFFII